MFQISKANCWLANMLLVSFRLCSKPLKLMLSSKIIWGLEDELIDQLIVTWSNPANNLLAN
jgi:hypothetical protein